MKKSPLPAKAINTNSTDIVLTYLKYSSNRDQMSADSVESVEKKSHSMNKEEYSELIIKWQQAYYVWNSSCVNYYK